MVLSVVDGSTSGGGRRVGPCTTSPSTMSTLARPVQTCVVDMGCVCTGRVPVILAIQVGCSNHGNCSGKFYFLRIFLRLKMSRLQIYIYMYIYIYMHIYIYIYIYISAWGSVTFNSR